jgi:hypothetical protein
MGPERFSQNPPYPHHPNPSWLEPPSYRCPPPLALLDFEKAMKVFRVRCSNKCGGGLAQAQRAWLLVPHSAYPANPPLHLNDQNQDVTWGTRS